MVWLERGKGLDNGNLSLVRDKIGIGVKAIHRFFRTIFDNSFYRF